MPAPDSATIALVKAYFEGGNAVNVQAIHLPIALNAIQAFVEQGEDRQE